MATIAQVREAMQHAPFTIRLVDGRSFTVKHRDYVAVPELAAGRGLSIYEGSQMHLVDIRLVQSVDFADAPADATAENTGA